MIIGDPIIQKILERVLRRSLTDEEKRGIKPVRVRSQTIKIPQISIAWIHNKNSCK